MLEMRIDSDNVTCEDLFVVQNNAMLVINKINLYNFIGTFYDLIEKNSSVSITIGNKRLDNKNVILLNLLDVSSIYDQMRFKKGSLLYEYIVNEINESIKDKAEEITEYLDVLFCENVNKSLFDYNINFSIDIQKLHLTFSDIEYELLLSDYVKRIDNLLDRTIERNPKKTFIIFKDFEYFNFDFISRENVYVFEINSPREPNIIIVDEVKNFDYEKTISYLKLMWPVEIEKQKLKDLLNNYINLFLKNKIIYTENQDMYLISYFFNKLYNLDNKMRLDSNTIYKNEAVKDFILSLK